MAFIEGSKSIGAKKPQKKKEDVSADFDLVTEFFGYRNKEDPTNLPPGYLVVGSKNVLMNTEGLASSRPGYSLYGQAGTATAPILSSFDWNRHTGDQRNVRGGNGKLQLTYMATAGDYYNGTTFTNGQVYWIDLLTGLASSYWNFATFWDNTTEKIDFLLGVNRSSNIYEWSGGLTTMLSATANTITKNGTSTWAQEGFYTAGTRSVTINGTVYTYTGGESTTTLTGVSPSPIAEPVNSVIFQTIRVTANSAMTGIPSTFRNDLISNLNNQIYVASLIDNNIYVSKIDNYKDYSYSTPTRSPGEGARLTLDGALTALIPQEEAMYASCGKDFWFQTVFTLSADLTSESLTVKKLKTSPLTAAFSQGLAVNMLNDIAYLTNEPTFSTLGNVQNVFISPQTVNLSDPIKNDFDDYGTDGFTDGTAIYHRYFMYVSVPTLGIVRVYNLAKQWWEAPWNLPIACFSIINGELYGHSYLTDESYKLLDGTNDNGNPIDSAAAFSYQNFGARGTQKKFLEFYVEGYISSNTALSVATKFDFGGVTGIQVYTVDGTGRYTNSIGEQINIPLFFTTADGSIGRNPIGTEPIGTITDSPSNLPKFRIIFTGVPQDFFEYQAFFETNDIDFQWEILAFGPKIQRGALPAYVTV